MQEPGSHPLTSSHRTHVTHMSRPDRSWRVKWWLAVLRFLSVARAKSTCRLLHHLHVFHENSMTPFKKLPAEHGWMGLQPGSLSH